MKKPKLSPWFPPYDKPVNVGAYQVLYFNLRSWYAFWDGQRWGAMGNTQEVASKVRNLNAFQENKWRGIVK